MGNLGYVKSFRDLFVYQEARQLSREIFGLSQRFPKEETYSLTDQVRRSSRSIGAQIAEAWAKRRYENHFISKLTDADGEQQETQHWIEIALDCNYLAKDEANMLLQRCQRIGRLLGGIIAKSDQFCGHTEFLREPTSEYFVDHPPITDNRLPITEHGGKP